MSKIARLAARLSPAQRHCLLRFSEAEDWCGSGRGMSRTWPDIVYGRKGAQYRSIRALMFLGLADVETLGRHDGYFLTSLGLSVQLEVRMQERGQ